MRDDLLDYAEEQLSLAGYSNDEVRVVLSVIETLAIDWPEVSYDRVLDAAKRILDGEHLQETPEPVEEESKWAPILLGDGTRPGHPVRVKPNAYQAGRHADEHNGRVGVFAGARNGYVYVTYDGETRDVHPAPHRPELVEKAVS